LSFASAARFIALTRSRPHCKHDSSYATNLHLSLRQLDLLRLGNPAIRIDVRYTL
jgi:hypothetical protein